MLVPKAFDQPVDDTLVEVLSTEEGVTRCADHLEHSRAGDLQDRNVERAAAQIKHRHGPVDVLSEAVRQRSRGRLVDDANHVEASDGTCIFGCLSLVVVEVRGHSNDNLVDLFTEIVLRNHLHLLQHHRANFGDAVDLVS